MQRLRHPRPEGLYDPAFEHDACGVGFVADIEGRPSHGLITQGIQILKNLTHRGAVGSDPDSGDGAGILMQVPDRFLRARAAEAGLELPPAGQYGVGMVFLPRGEESACQEVIERVAAEEGCRVLGWRDVPLRPETLGPTAGATRPTIRQVFLAGTDLEGLGLERRLFLVRRLVEKSVTEAGLPGAEHFHIASLSGRTLVYKGMLVARQVAELFPDLESPEMETAIAVVHQRYSTNTFPSWPLAQPFRLIGHNGEINTLRGNINKMIARYPAMQSKVWGCDLEKLLPVVIGGGSDSACFDNVLELLVLSGRSLPHAILMMIPEAWGAKYYMGHDRRGFYEYHATFMEPWDGPAAMAFTDGVQVGGILDRNGLRPARYTITKQGLMVLGSETGVLDIDPADVLEKGRLQPGKMTLVDTARRRVLYNDEIKAEICRRRPYRRWVAANRIELRGFLDGTGIVTHEPETLLTRQVAFGYSREDLDVLMLPMAREGKEPIGSMGNDTPLAILSDRPQLLFHYFKQNFAQVTNPAIDPIREELVMSLTTFLGREGNLLEETPEHARRLKLLTPILTDDDLGRIREAKRPEFRSVTLDMTFDAADGPEGLAPALHRLSREAEEAAREGFTVLILSDREVAADRAPIPSLLAVSAVGHHLTRAGLRQSVGLVVESGEPREVNHFALLSGYGADAMAPYLAFEALSAAYEEGLIGDHLTLQQAVENYIKAIEKGMLKILSKMGISTLRSYRGAQVYEAVGLERGFVDACFEKTPARLGGLDIAGVARETLERHREAFHEHRGREVALPSGGQYAYRRDGERHLWSPEAIFYLQQAARRNDPALYRRFAATINDQATGPVTVRSLLEIRTDGAQAVPLDEVEPAESIVRRFVTGAMSFGSLSREAHEAMAVAMNRLGGMSNSGEGGEDPARYEPLPGGDSRSSATKQVASGRFGVTAEYLVNAREIQIKIAQGAKPGEGGQLPGHKVNVEIARVRHSTPGVSLISPPPHHDIYSIEDLAQLIFDLKNVNDRARINVKLVSEVGVGTIAAGVAKGHADAVLISGGDGGTGASPLSSIKHAGMPWELGLAETHQTLVMNGLRGRIRVQSDGQMRTGRDVAVACLLGAEEFGFGTAALIVLGCVMMRKCHLNTCPVGVATQDPRCRRRFTGRPDHLVTYLHFVAEELRGIMAGLGLRTVDEMVGRTDLLRKRDDARHWKARALDVAPLLHRPDAGDEPRRRVEAQDHGLDTVLDRQLLADCAPAIESASPVEATYPIRNVNRATGTMLSGAVARATGSAGLPEGTIRLTFRGSAGQSFGAFGMRGLTLLLEGDANDYTGKGLSGATLVVRPPREATFDAAENVLVGNTVLYGATAGTAYFSGLAGERFAVRNSGAVAVVEGVGDHGCEYMTGGTVAVLGRTGVNFAAGMSGGIAFVYDPLQDFDLRCNLDMVDLEPLTEAEDQDALKAMIEAHHRHTDSARAAWMLANWGKVVPLFVKVIPMEYRRALGKMARVELGARRTEEEVVQDG